MVLQVVLHQMVLGGGVAAILLMKEKGGENRYYSWYPEVPGFLAKSGPVRDAIEKRLIDALERVEAHGDVAPFHVHDPNTMLLRENAIQAHLMRWNDFRGKTAGELPLEVALPVRSYRSAGAASMARCRHGNLRRLRSRNTWRRPT
jgi:hypothetical protein